MRRVIPLTICILGLVGAALVMRDYRRFEAFYESPDGAIELRSIFRPNLELMVMSSGLFPRRPELLSKERAMIERAMHVHPKAQLLCRYAEVLYASGEPDAADAALARMLIAYDSTDCPMTR